MSQSQPQKTRIEQIAQDAAARRRAKNAAKAPKDRMPWIFVIGLVLFVLGALSAGNGGGGFAAIAIVLGIAGVIGGIVQYVVGKKRRAV